MRLAPGTFGWVDLLTPSVPAAKTFYAGIFDWSFEDLPTPVGVDYTMCRVDGQVVCGLAPLPQAMADAGQRPAWNSYVIVADADACAAASEAAGGSVVMPAMDVMASGRMVMVSGPDGAVIGAWQPREHQGAEVFDEPGTVTWNELHSSDLTASREFLSAVFGWRWQRQPGAMEYWVAHVGASSDEVCGAMHLPEDASDDASSAWAVYFAVDDCDTRAGHVAELGGALFVPPMDMGPGRFAGATDPGGAAFYFGSFPDPA